MEDFELDRLAFSLIVESISLGRVKLAGGDGLENLCFLIASGIKIYAIGVFSDMYSCDISSDKKFNLLSIS